jgi:HlyD family secretion protein
MLVSWKKRIASGLALALVVVGLAWLAWPRPIGVDLAAVTRGPMEVTVDDEAKTRVRHHLHGFGPDRWQGSQNFSPIW